MKKNFLTKRELQLVEDYADKLFKDIGIDIEFTYHFFKRVNDLRNKKQITKEELMELFKDTRQKFGSKIEQLGPDAQAVLHDMDSNINMPFVLKWDGKELDLLAKTVLRKKNFLTSNKKFSV